MLSYQWSTLDAGRGHGDWLYDEFRLGERGEIMHEIEWSGGGRWIIGASDVEFRWILV